MPKALRLVRLHRIITGPSRTLQVILLGRLILSGQLDVGLKQLLPTPSHAPVIMSRRTLGGGRVLGTPTALSSAPSPSPQSRPRVLSPTASSVSLNSQTSASQFSTETQDLTSRISLENGDTSISAAPAAPGAQLSCPICSEEMVRLASSDATWRFLEVLLLTSLQLTLLQLNRYLSPPGHPSPTPSVRI